MTIPKQFIIHNHLIKIIRKEYDSTNESRYGYYDSVREEIVLFNKVKSEGELVSLTETQIEASFWHELVHCFQWHIKGECDEIEAQSYAGLMCEFITSSKIKIDPNVIHIPINNNDEDI